MAPIKRLSLVDQVYEKLREQIVTLQIPFGSKLNVIKLQEEYGVSSTPVREAMNRLLNDGLIEFENNVGARVIDFTDDDVRQVMEVALGYQMVAVRYALVHGDIDAMSEEMEKYIDEYRKTPNIGDSCKCIRAILGVFYRNADNEMLLAKVSSINGMDDILYSLSSMTNETCDGDGQEKDGIVIFEDILESFRAQDFARICDALEEHQLWSMKYIVKNLESLKSACASPRGE